MKPSLFRLSIIIPILSWHENIFARWSKSKFKNAFTERTIQSILDQDDPIHSEVILVDDGTRNRVVNHVGLAFGEALQRKKLRILTVPSSGDPSLFCNEAALGATGRFLCFSDPTLVWKPNLLKFIHDHYEKNQLLLFTQENPPESSDWLKTFASNNYAIPGFGVIRRDLFEKSGGFPVGYLGQPFPKKIPGMADYELWVKALFELQKQDKVNEFRLLRTDLIEKLSDPTGLVSADKIDSNAKKIREAISRSKLAPILPKAYWPALLSGLKNKQDS